MMFHTRAANWAVVATVLVAGCSTTPRLFDPVIAGSTAVGEAEIVAGCREMVDAGVTSNFMRDGVGPAATGVVAGYGAGAVAFAGAGSTMVGSAAAASTAMVAMPVVGIAAGVIYARHVRSRRERQRMAAMTLCLGEHGLEVSDWVLSRPERRP